MFLLLLKLLKKYDYNIDKSNVKYFLKTLRMEKEKEDLLIQQQIIKMLDDIENVKKLEDLARLEILRRNENEDLER